MASCRYPNDPIPSPDCNGLIYPEGIPVTMEEEPQDQGNTNNLIPGVGGAVELQDMDGMASSSLKVSDKPKTKGKKRSRTSKSNGEEEVDLLTDWNTDLQFCLHMIKNAKIWPPILEDSSLTNWPMRIDLKNIKKKISGIKMKDKKTAVDPEIIKKSLEEVDKDIRISDENRIKNYSDEFLREKLSEAFPWLFVGKTATNWPIAEQKYTDMEKELFEKNKKTKDISDSDFPGLEEAVKAAGQGIPEYLKAIAIKVEEACGESIHNRYRSILILVCAAIYEMEYCKGIELLEWERLLIWGATYNMAKEISVFKLHFVETHLKMILKAYYDHKFYNQKRVQELKAELKVMEDCKKAKNFFNGNFLSHGLFPP
ncbi:hydrolase-like protein [Corchorus olitorius]|uniref:Hydrolase-like protein n=1 Tax=Corchorus olitorius TaxID=93759 RepID=A0A1R3HDC3_9ROSI|nr:hydrolase-like protein [Corchorus olitorius]